MKPRNVKKVISGAVLGSILGTVGAVMLSKKLNYSGWAEDLKNFGERVLKNHGSEIESEPENSTFVKGTLLGVLIGAGSALLLAPKTGTQLRKDLIRGYQDIADKTQEILEYVNHKNVAIKRRPLKRAIKRTLAVPKAKMKAKHLN